MRKSTRLMAILLAVLMTVSVFPVSVFAANNTIEAVDTSGLVMETVFPYNAGSGSAYWSTYVSKVTEPTFYTTIPATVDGVSVDLPVTWVSDDYVSTECGTYTFTAVAEGYTWECEAPVITVEVVDAGWTAKAARQGFISNGVPVPYVIKWNGSANKIYDATGCNLISSCTPGDGLVAFGGMHNTVGGKGKTAPAASNGKSDVTVTGKANITTVYGGGHGKAHTGGATIKINDATVGTVYSGSYRTTMAGTTTIDISGNVTISNVFGGGDNYQGTHAGDMIVTIHDLAESAKISSIKRSRATNLIVNLDDTSKHLIGLGAITIDDNTTVYINGDVFEGLLDENVVTDIPATIIKGEASTVLPTTFGGISGFVWEGDDTVAGEKIFTLTAPEGYFFADLTKTKEYTILVNNEYVPVTDVTIDQDNVNLYEGGRTTLTATVLPDNANDKTVKWSSNNTDIAEVDEDTGVVRAKSVGTATITATSGSVSDTCEVTVGQAIEVSEVLTDGLVLSTVFPYNDTDSSAYWSTYASYVESPVFYQTIPVKIDGLDVDLPVTWVCTDENGDEVEYDGTATGTTYYFVAEAMGYKFAGGAPVIEAKVADAGWTVQNYRKFSFISSGDTVPYVVKGGDSTHTVYDATGFNKITSYAIPNAGGNDYNVAAGLNNTLKGAGKTGAAKSEGDISVSVSDATLSNIYGGGFNIPHVGDTYVYISDTTLVGKSNATNVAVYGGGYQANVTGNAYIDISGVVDIPQIIGGGNGGTVSGTTTVKIHDLKTGWEIGSIKKGDASALVIELDDPQVVSAIFTVIDDLTGVTVKLNGVPVDYVTEVEAPSKSVYTTQLGTAANAIGLPSTLAATVNGRQSELKNVTWTCENYDANTAGKYIFTPVVSNTESVVYDLSQSNFADLSLVVRVLTGNPIQQITAFESIDVISVSLGTNEEQLPLPTTVNATVGGNTVAVEVDLWTCSSVYDGSVHGAEYTYTATISGEYSHSVAAPTVVVKITNARITQIYVPVTETTFPRGAVETPVFYDTLKVKLDNGIVTELSGFEWTVADYSKNTTGTFTATISKVPENYAFAASLTIPSIKITVKRQQHDVMVRDAYIYLNGIPTVVDGTSSETYLFDMTGCNKLSEKNIAGKTIYAGGPANSASLKTTMIEMRGGKLGSIYGGSRDSTKITDSTYVYVLGGSLSQIYGGGNGLTTSATMAVTQNTYVYVENANVTSRVSASGYNGNVEEDAVVIIKNSTLNGIYAGSYSKKIGNIEGTATIKLLDGAQVGTFYGAGRSPIVNELEVYLSKNSAITKKFDVMGQSNIKGTAKIFFETGFDLSKVYTEETQVELYEGHFLEDRETFVTDREVKVIRNGGFVRGDFYVEKGTSLENIGLPTTVNGEIDGNPETISGISYSPVGSYDGNKAGRYEFKLNIPDGYNVPPTTIKNAGKVTVVVADPAQRDTITTVFGENTEYIFANGTAIENIGLPSAYNVVLSAAGQKTVPVKNWTVKDENGRTVTFDSYTAGTYVFTPEFDSAYTVSAELPTHTVTISAYRPYRSGNTRYLSGIPADIGNMMITDKNGNYLGQAGTWTTVYGGSASADVDSTDVTVNNGTLYGLYGGSAGRNVKGDIKVTINSGTIPYLYAGSVQGTANNVELTINAGSITNAYGANNFTCYGSIKHTVNGGTITNYYIGDSNANGSARGTAQAEDEVLALSTEKDKGKIVVSKGELISIEYVQNGGSVRALYGGGNGASTANGSVKMYLNGGTANVVSGTGTVAGSSTLGNVYIVMADGFVCDTIYANQPGSIYGKAYVVIPESFNRYNILGWYESDEIISDDTDMGGDEDEDAALEDADVRAEVIVSGGYYEEGIPIIVMYVSSTQTVFARGVPIKIIGETAGGSSGEDEDLEDETVADLTTYVWYFDEHYDEQTETPETFSYETYVDAHGNPVVLTGVWRKYPEPLTDGATAIVYGGGMNGISDIYPSTYVEFNSGQTKGVYGGGKNKTVGAANLILDPKGPISPGSIYGAGNQDVNARANKVYIKVLGGSYGSIVAGGYKASTNGAQVDILGGSVSNIYLGGYTSACVTAGEVTLNLENCTVGNVYAGGYGDGSSTLGSAYINVNDNVNITGTVYPKGVGKRADGVNSGPVTLWAYVNLNDTDKASAQFKKIKYTKSQAPYVYINGVAMGEMPKTSTASFEHADKKVEVTTAEASDYRGNRALVFLNGIPAVIAGDGAGHSYAYQAKTKDGTLNVYQKNEDGTFKYDENGERISNIVRDPVTGQAIKGPKLVDIDLIDSIVYGGANGKSVEDTYVEFHNGGGVWVFYAGCRGGHAGYDEQGNEVGLIEVRQFDGGAFDLTYIGSVPGNDLNGAATVNVFTTKTVFLGIGGGTKYISFGGVGGTIGSEEKFMDGYYNRAGEVISYTDPDDNQVHEITGTWEDYNLDVKKSDYAEYYESSNAYFNGEDNTDFLESDFYVDPYDDHYTIYALTAAYSSNHYYLGTTASQFNYSINRVYGNAYARQSAYGLKYDAELDMFVEDYNEYMGMDTFFPGIYAGSSTGVRYNDVRVDWEAVPSTLRPLGNKDGGALNLGHTYLNLYETDTVSQQNNEVYNKITVTNDSRVTVNRNFFPKWSFTVAWALDLEPEMVQIALDKGYVNGATKVKDVRISMVRAEDAARLLNYYYAGSFDQFVTTENEEESRGWQEVFDASGDIGKFTIRHFNMISPSGQGINRYLIYNNSRFGDGQLITFPNGETMLIDCGLSEPATLVKDIRYVLEQLEEQGIGDGKTIDYFVITHYHSDHYGNAPEILNAFDIKNFVLPPFDKNGVPAGYVVTAQRMSDRYVAEGKDPINFIRVKRDDKFTIGEGDSLVDVYVTNPGDHSYRTFTLAEGIRRSENGGYGSFANPYSIAFKFTFKGQTYFTGADIREDAEVSMLRTYGKDFLKCDVMKLSHHGHATSNIWAFNNAINPDVTIQNAEGFQYVRGVVPKYFENNNTGGYDENAFSTAKEGNIKVTLDGENVTSVTQWQVRAYERNGDEYKNSSAAYETLVDRVKDTRNALTVVADNSSAPYGTAYIWNSYANYIDGQLEELSKRYYSGTMTLDMMADYTEKLLDLEEFIDDATMYGGSDTTPDVEVPGTPDTDVGGGETTTPGASGGIIGDIGGGDAGSGIGGGAAPGGAVVGPTGPSTDDGETDTPVTPTPDDDRRFIDVATTDWFNNAVNYVADNNYFQGVSENQFDPSGKMTRAMLVTVIGRMAKADTSEAVNNFTDVEDGSWYAGYVAWAAENGIVTGVGDSKFAPNDNVTREQIAAILMRYATYKGIDVSVSSTEKYDLMKDTASVSEYAVEALKWATANAVINGAEGNINPRGNATRAEVAQMIMNFCNTFSI